MKVEHIKTAHSGTCTACNLHPKWLSYKSHIGGVTYRLGDTCRRRVEILRDIASSWKDEGTTVFLFKVLESV